MENNDADLISSISASSSRTERINYLNNVLGLDRGTAALLVRAERLQEKGQLRQALKYYEVACRHSRMPRSGCE
jgi:hypothetical protein